MPGPHQQRPRSREQRQQQTENARRQRRYRFARERIGKIVTGAPPLTTEQRLELARLLTAGDAA
jgi:hypothetical protein